MKFHDAWLTVFAAPLLRKKMKGINITGIKMSVDGGFWAHFIALMTMYEAIYGGNRIE